VTEQIGRYQLIAHPAGYVLLFIDTATGRLWEYHADDKVWDEMKNPKRQGLRATNERLDNENR